MADVLATMDNLHCNDRVERPVISLGIFAYRRVPNRTHVLTWILDTAALSKRKGVLPHTSLTVTKHSMNRLEKLKNMMQE